MSLFDADERMTELVLDHCRRRLSLDPVPIDFGGSRPPAPGALDGLIGEEGRDAAEVLETFVGELSRSILSSDSERYLAFIPAAPSKASLLFDMVVSSASFPGTSWFEAAGVVVAENQALRVLADAAGLGDRAGGCFVSGGSSGNLSALFVARETAGQLDPAAPPRIAVSAEAHASVKLALRVIGVDAMEVPCDDHRLTGAALRRALDRDARADTVIGVVATAGTTNAGIVDDLDGLADVAGERGMWFHVDGAYGAAALLAPRLRQRFRGIERADSLVVDPHKWLFAPFDSAALLYRDPARASAVLAQKASYIDVMHSEPSAWNPGDYAFHLTRRPRGLPFWFSLAVNGMAAYREAIERAVVLAQRAAEMIQGSSWLELVREPELSVVLFRRPGWDAADYLKWSTRLLSDQVALVAPTTWEGQPVARLAFLHPQTPLELVEEILAAMR